MSDREKLIERLRNQMLPWIRNYTPLLHEAADAISELNFKAIDFEGRYLLAKEKSEKLKAELDRLISNGVTVQTGLRSPFENDIFALIWKAFKNLYPEKDCQCFWEPRIRDEEDGTEIYGLTDWDEDGNISVFVKPELSVLDAAEIFAHELAHVAVGCDAGHGKEWENAFDKIFEEYNRLGDELFDIHDAVSVTDGKAYVTEPPKECE